MDSDLVDFLKGMVKPMAALAVPAVAVFLSYLEKLELEREMPYSIARAFLQLSVIGFVLQFIFLQQNVGWILLAYLFMGATTLLSAMNTEWLHFLKGMVKPVAALAVPAVAVFLSHLQKLELEKEMPYSIARAFLQLSVIGFVLQFIFHQQNVGWILLAYLFMVSVAAYTAGQRAHQVPYSSYVAGASIMSGTSFTLCLLVILNVFPFTPRYIIPIAGMMVGNAMTVTGVTMRRLREDLKQQQILVETALALGASPRQAMLPHVRRAIKLALSPAIDNAKTVGLISLPGAMTGLILGGSSPLEAIQLQLVVMNMVMGASTFSSIMSTYLGWRVFFTKTCQLKTEVLMLN